jgi:glucose/arabinose dehydrogenase
MKALCTSIAILLFSNVASSYTLEKAFPKLIFEKPLDFKVANDGNNLIYVVEQRGFIYVFQNKISVSDRSVFLDIRDRVRHVSSEEGLLGLAFHPKFKTNRKFYVNYTTSKPRRTIIAQYLADTKNPSRAEKTSEKIILEIKQPYANHNGGGIVFGPDGYLYIGMGDGGWMGDPHGHGQNLRTRLGAMLRIDVDQPQKNKPYGIPKDNPFAGNNKKYKEEIYAYGLRNPWRFSFDSVTNNLWVADVGQDAIEEVNILEKGKNYGWNIMEGRSCYNPKKNCPQSNLSLPIAQYTHTIGQSITGGFVYRGKRISGLYGKYIFADFVTGRIWSLTKNKNSQYNLSELIDSDLFISSFGIDQHQNLYMLAFDGYIYKLNTDN